MSSLKKFIVTKELGRLAKWLRIFGFDTTYFKQTNFSSLLITAFAENRIIVTRNTKIGTHCGLRIIAIKSNFLHEQLIQIFKDLHLTPQEDKMFSRCTICNKELATISKVKVKSKVPEYVYKTQKSFVICPICNRIYWQGTHWGNVKELINAVCS